MKALTATLRLQFHKDFTLDHATALVPYFEKLGISHLYASPILTARAGSMHGYDVVDPTRINPELGGEAALRRLVAALRERNMGLILDIVSNHMAVGGNDNPWWLDVLEWGRRSPYAEFFDIQWNSPDPLLEGQLLIPFLGNDYGAVLQAGEAPLRFEAATGSFYVEHYQHRFPINPRNYGAILTDAEHPALNELSTRFTQLNQQIDAYNLAITLRGELAALVAELPEVGAAIELALKYFDSTQPNGFQRLHQLLERQYYRLASWRTAGDDINWRRFFDVNELGGLRVERPTVFEATHSKIFELVANGLIDGLRIDHIDGLADPRGYSRKLRRRVDSLQAQRPANATVEHFPIFVEKILGEGETLHRDWNVDGTTGYEFMNQVSLLQHDPRGGEVLGEFWQRLTERPAAFMEEALAARHLVLNGSLAGDFESVAQALLLVARGDVMSRDLTLGAIRRALQELIVHFPVYRTYVSACGRPAEDEPFFQQALQGARSTLGEADWPVLDYLQRWLGGEPLRDLPPGPLRKARKHACVRFQQLTSPSAAKAVEDTAFYRSAVLLSRNDVGFDTQHFSAPPEDFHAAALQRVEAFPDNLLTTATHDHKRGEDTRTRLAVLSERGTWYVEQAQSWLQLASGLTQETADGPAPTRGDELMLFQTLLGSWPLGLNADANDDLQAYAERMGKWQEKALREAKLRSSWSAPNEVYESACREYLQAALLEPRGLPLRQLLANTVQAIAPAGALNSLTQTLLRMTAPGVPDLYQGAEFWDFSLVDPDNRRPVDYAARALALAETHTAQELLEHWTDGRIKQALIAQTLAIRAQYPELFHSGHYQALTVVGAEAARVLAFARIGAGSAQGQYAVVIVPRLASALLAEQQLPYIDANTWGDTRVVLPFTTAESTNWTGLFSRSVVTHNKELALASALENFPVNIFVHTER